MKCVCRVASSVALRTLATRGRKREAPRRQAWGDGAERKVRGTISLTTSNATNATNAANAAGTRSNGV